jgi:hypothetical protein
VFLTLSLSRVELTHLGQFYIPGERVFGAGDKIPFHIQLIGCLDSLKLYMPAAPESYKSTSERRAAQGASSSWKNASVATPVPTTVVNSPVIKYPGGIMGSNLKIEVKLVRRVTVHVKNQTVSAESVISEGTVRFVGAWQEQRLTSGSNMRLEWEGRVRPPRDSSSGVAGISFGEFDITNASVEVSIDCAFRYLSLRILIILRRIV